MRIEQSYIPVHGVGKKRERSLWKRGATHWNRFDPDLLGETTGRRVEAFIERAEPRLQDGDVDFFAEAFPNRAQWRLYENFRGETLFLDIETTGLDRMRDVVTTVSVHQSGETETLVRGRDLTPDRLAAHLEDAPLVATFNGAQFDLPFLETALNIDIDRPHLDLRFLARRVGLTGGLKDIEGLVGIERDRPDISGRDAIRLWREYERGDRAALETLCEYNRWDTRNLEPLADRLVSRLDRSVRPAEWPGEREPTAAQSRHAAVGDPEREEQDQADQP
ncbi:MAG: ribonuclease H-like domain-containing protein [Halodesulfurarchaeum sp.]